MYADNVALPAFACRKPLLLSAGRAATGLLLWAPRWDRQTDE